MRMSVKTLDLESKVAEKWTKRKGKLNKRRLDFIWKLESKLYGKSNWVIIMCAKLIYAYFFSPFLQLHELFCEFDGVCDF